MKHGFENAGRLFRAWRLPITDDAGIERELLSVREQPSGTARLNRVRDKAHLVYGELVTLRRIAVRTAVLILPFCLVFPLVIAYARPLGLQPIWPGIGFLVVVMPINWLLMRRDFFRLSGRAGEVADAYLDEGVCPCCAFNLGGVLAALAESADEKVRCSECGAVWNRPRIHRFGEEETASSHEKRSFTSVLRAVAMLYNSMAFTDDAGKPVSLARYGDLKQLRLIANGTHRDRLAICIAELRFRGLWKRLLIASVVFPLAIGVIAAFARRPLATMGLMQGFQLLALVSWVVGAVAILLSDLGRSGEKRAAILRAQGLCPACGNLLPAPVGGEARCTECRALWKYEGTARSNAG